MIRSHAPEPEDTFFAPLLNGTTTPATSATATTLFVSSTTSTFTSEAKTLLWLHHSVPEHLLPVFLLILALHTCVPVPKVVALVLGIVLSLAHLVAVAVFAPSDDFDSGIIYKKVGGPKRSVFNSSSCAFEMRLAVKCLPTTKGKFMNSSRHFCEACWRESEC